MDRPKLPNVTRTTLMAARKVATQAMRTTIKARHHNGRAPKTLREVPETLRMDSKAPNQGAFTPSSKGSLEAPLEAAVVRLPMSLLMSSLGSS